MLKRILFSTILTIGFVFFAFGQQPGEKKEDVPPKKDPPVINIGEKPKPTPQPTPAPTPPKPN